MKVCQSVRVMCSDGDSVRIDAGVPISARVDGETVVLSGLDALLDACTDPDGWFEFNSCWKWFGEGYDAEHTVVEAESPATVRIYNRAVVGVGLIYVDADV